MKFVKVDKVPERNRKKRLREFLDEFMSANIKVAKVELNEGDYKTPEVRARCIYHSVKMGAYPIRVTRVKDEVFLIRKDM